MDFRTIRVERDNTFATVWLDRPHRNNAWTGTMHGEFCAAMDTLNEDPSVRVVIITGEGKMFCPGADEIGRAHV